MYLTKIVLNKQKLATRTLLSSPHKIHGAVNYGFVENIITNPAEGRILWRVEQLTRDPYLLVSSPHLPDFAHIQERYGWETAPQQTKHIKNFIEQIQTGEKYLFRTTANPVIVSKKRRIPHITDTHIKNWFSEKMFSLGIQANPDDFYISNTTGTSFKRNANSKVTLNTATFQGKLQVVDNEKLKKILAHGYGKSKAYGCGLFSLSKI